MTKILSDATPWYTWSAIAWLNDFLKPCMDIFEWGSGGSTIYFASRCASVISVEHDKPLVPELWASIQELGIQHKAHIIIELPEDYYIQEYESQDKAYADTHNFKNYASTIDRYPQGHFDLVAVDGRARSACMRHAIARVKPGGALLLDNAERYHYTPGVDAIPKDWQQICFYDHGPFIHYRWLTVVWVRPE